MMLHSLFLYQSDYKIITENIVNNSSTYTGFNFIKYLNNSTYTSLMKHITKQIINNNVNTLFVLLDNCDNSLKVKELHNLKSKYQLKIIFFFMDSKNSFEYIDRYYAQIADLVILDGTPFIDDFYKLLSIETFTLNNSLKLKSVKRRNIFSSSLINLTSESHTIYNPMNSSQNLQEQFKHMFVKLSNSSKNNEDLLIDKKNIYAQTVYEIYWNLYHFHKNYDLNIFYIQYWKYIIEIYKINKQIKRNRTGNMQVNIIDLLNRALYKKYTL